jgi:hypothetical protein
MMSHEDQRHISKSYVWSLISVGLLAMIDVIELHWLSDAFRKDGPIDGIIGPPQLFAFAMIIVALVVGGGSSIQNLRNLKNKP